MFDDTAPRRIASRELHLFALLLLDVLVNVVES